MDKEFKQMASAVQSPNMSGGLGANAIRLLATEAVEQDTRIAAIEDTIAKLQAVIDHFRTTSESHKKPDLKSEVKSAIREVLDEREEATSADSDDYYREMLARENKRLRIDPEFWKPPKNKWFK